MCTVRGGGRSQSVISVLRKSSVGQAKRDRFVEFVSCVFLGRNENSCNIFLVIIPLDCYYSLDSIMLIFFVVISKRSFICTRDFCSLLYGLIHTPVRIKTSLYVVHVHVGLYHMHGRVATFIVCMPFSDHFTVYVIKT